MPTTVFSATAATNDSGNNGYSFRCRVTTTAGGLGQVRVRFIAPDANTFQTDHVSIGLAVTSPTPPSAGGTSTQATPVELLFTGASGFTITAGNTLTSDWATLAFNNGDDLVVIIDFHSSNGNEKAQNSGGHLYYQAATATYADSSPSSAGWLGQTEILAWVAGFNLIETQSAGGSLGVRVFESVLLMPPSLVS